MLLFYVLFVCFALTMYLNENPANRPIFIAEIITIFPAEFMILQVKTYKVSLFQNKRSIILQRYVQVMDIHAQNCRRVKGNLSP